MHKPAAYVRQSDGLVRIGNDLIALGFDPAQNGALVSVLDVATGYEFRRDRSAPATLFRLALRRSEDTSIEWLTAADAAHFEWGEESDGGRVTLTLTASGFPGRDVRVAVSISLQSDSALSTWRMRVSGAGEAAVHCLVCPSLSGVVTVGETTPADAIVFPRQGEGWVFHDPFPVRDRLPLCAGEGHDTPDAGVGDLHGLYPGRISMQMCAYYNDRAGLYLATHDAGQNVKSFDVAASQDAERSPVFSISHLPSEEPGRDAVFEYDTVLGVFHGDWYDAADIYKAWATQQWWCEKKLWERDIPEWMRKGFGVFQMSNYHMPKLKLNHPVSEIADTVNALSEETGVPLLGLIFNWEREGAWTGPSGFFPPREGEVPFREAMQSLRRAGNYGFVYITGGCWYLSAEYDPPFNSEERFEAEAQGLAILSPEGEALRTKPAGILWAARLCPGAEGTGELTTSVLLGCLDLDCTVVQIDNFPCGGSEACHDPAHGHAPGHGAWWSEAWGKALADTRQRAKARNPDCAIAAEGVSENFIPYLDLFDHRASNAEYWGTSHYRRGDPMGGRMIPLFGYVYHQYICAYSAAMPECNRPEVLYWTRCVGKALAQGVVPTTGMYFPEPAEPNPVTIGFFKKVVRAGARECRPYLLFGEMLRPPEIDVPTITASYCMISHGFGYIDPRRRHEVIDAAVEHSAWRGRDGSIGYLFINVSEDPVGFDVELSAYGTEAEAFDIERITDGEREAEMRGVDLPRTERIDMAPLSVTLVRVLPCT